MKRKSFVWLAIPLGIILLLAAAILALPSLVASADHRATIEALASSVAGRKVHIAGSLSLNLFPEPRISAGNVTIDGTNGETIKARSLLLDISIPALLRGQLTANNLVLQSPVIAFPWPLPGGPSAVAPPPWLTTLHAQINNGQISFGDLIFSGINADIFTGSQGALSISGTGSLGGQLINLTMSLGAIDLAGQAPLAATVKTDQLTANFSGQFSTGNIINGNLQGVLHDQILLSRDPKQDVNFSASMEANPSHLALTGLSLAQGPGHLNGSARLDIAAAALTVILTGADISTPVAALPDDLSLLHGFTVHTELSIGQLGLGKFMLPHLNEISDLSANGLSIASSEITFAGSTTASLTGNVDQNGDIHAQAHLNSPDLSKVLTVNPGWPLNTGRTLAISLASPVTGSLARMNFANITGTLNASAVTGSTIIAEGRPVSMNMTLHFKQLNLLSAASLLQQAAMNQDMAGNFEITAEHADLLNVPVTHLLIDGGFSNSLNIRRLSASLYDGMMLGNLTMQPDGTITAAHALVSLPSAAALAAVFPSATAIPAAVLNKPFALWAAAAGSANALATQAAVTLGQFSASASPVIDLTKTSLAGPVTLRHPSAITAFKLFGINAGLAWPGAGSLSLRADFNLSNDGFALPNFVATIGDLTAAGKISESGDGHLNADIAADTLALPALPSDLSAFWKALPALNGNINIAANRVLIAGTPYLAASNVAVTMQPGKFVLNIAKAGFSGGILNGNLAIAQMLPQPPSLLANFSLTNLDLSKAGFPLAFPVTLPTGTASATINLNANGFTPQTWLATMSGSVNAQAANGTVSGFSLTGLSAALNSPNRASAMKTALQTGTTPFAALHATGGIDHGVFKFQDASLQGPAGSATVAGTIDLSDYGLALNFGLLAQASPPVTAGLAVIGSWSSPHKVPALKSALAWQAGH